MGQRGQGGSWALRGLAAQFSSSLHLDGRNQIFTDTSTVDSNSSLQTLSQSWQTLRARNYTDIPLALSDLRCLSVVLKHAICGSIILQSKRCSCSHAQCRQCLHVPLSPGQVGGLSSGHTVKKQRWRPADCICPVPFLP